MTASQNSAYSLCQRRGGALRLLPALTIGLVLAGATSVHAAADFSCGSRFEFRSDFRVFDGVEVEFVHLFSTDIQLNAASFGAWIPMESPERGFGLTLRHKVFSKVRFGLCALVGDNSPRSPDVWNQYVEVTKARLGPFAVASDLRDSTGDNSVVQRLGWTTRHITLDVPATEKAPALREIHVVSSSDTVSMRFVLYGPPADVDKAAGDFSFFLSRLSPRK